MIAETWIQEQPRCTRFRQSSRRLAMPFVTHPPLNWQLTSGRLQSLDWTSGLDWCTGLVD